MERAALQIVCLLPDLFSLTPLQNARNRPPAKKVAGADGNAAVAAVNAADVPALKVQLDKAKAMLGSWGKPFGPVTSGMSQATKASMIGVDSEGRPFTDPVKLAAYCAGLSSLEASLQAKLADGKIRCVAHVRPPTTNPRTALVPIALSSLLCLLRCFAQTGLPRPF